MALGPDLKVAHGGNGFKAPPGLDPGAAAGTFGRMMTGVHGPSHSAPVQPAPGQPVPAQPAPAQPDAGGPVPAAKADGQAEASSGHDAASALIETTTAAANAAPTAPVPAKLAGAAPSADDKASAAGNEALLTGAATGPAPRVQPTRGRAGDGDRGERKRKDEPAHAAAQAADPTSTPGLVPTAAAAAAAQPVGDAAAALAAAGGQARAGTTAQAGLDPIHDSASAAAGGAPSPRDLDTAPAAQPDLDVTQPDTAQASLALPPGLARLVARAAGQGKSGLQGTDDAAPAASGPAAAAHPLQTAVLKPDLLQPSAPAGAPAPHNADPSAANSAADAALHRQLAIAQDGAWLDGLARDIAQTAGKDGALRFRLDPATLGSLHVEVTHGRDGASIRLIADSEAARVIIADAQPRLVAEARAQGVRIAQTHVDLGAGTGQGTGQQRRPDTVQPETFRTFGAAGAESDQPRLRTQSASERFA